MITEGEGWVKGKVGGGEQRTGNREQAGCRSAK
jgi:hypothetical protein